MSYKILKVYDHVLEDPRLMTLREKYLVSYIWSWQEQCKNCFASDEFLSSLLSLSPGDLHKLLNDLQKRRILKINYGSNRMLQVITPDNYTDCEENDPRDIFEFL